MKMMFTFKHLDHSDALETYTKEKIDEVSRFLLKHGHGNCVFSKTRSFFSVEVSLNTKMKFFRASSNHPDVYAAVDEVVSKLEKQFLKVRKQARHHRKAEIHHEKRRSIPLDLEENAQGYMVWKRAA